MRAVYRLVLFTALAVVMTGTLGATVADADPINVAEFRWETLDPGTCGDIDPCLSIFSLTNIWDGPDPGDMLLHSRLLLPSGDEFLFDLAAGVPFDFQQAGEIVFLPGSALASVSFLFGGEVISLAATLTDPDTFTVLQFTPVPEPGTLGLVLLGATFLARHARRRRQ